MTDHDKYQQEIICRCASCGDPISRYYYVGYPFCNKCRSEYNKQKDQRSQIYHSFSREKYTENIHTKERYYYDAPLCGVSHNRGSIADLQHPVNCKKCLKILDKNKDKTKIIECKNCQGEGVIEYSYDGGQTICQRDPCPICHGEGKIRRM